jgi:hypothetical protein
MKRMGIILGTVFLFAISGFSAEKTFSFVISGGMTRLGPHDLNSFLQDYARYYLSFGTPTGADGQGEVAKTLRRSSEFELTLLVRAAPRIFLTFGSGFISARLESDPLLLSYSDLEEKLSRSDKIRSIPVRLGLLYSWPLSRRLNLSPHVSLDAYISSFKETGCEETKDLAFNVMAGCSEWDIRTNALSWGSTWGLSLGFDLAGGVSLFLDGGYRRARLGGFRGTQTRSENGVIESESDFRLLYYEFYSDWMDTGYKYLNLPMAYGSAPLDLVRDAVLDLSGPYLKAGLRISF